MGKSQIKKSEQLKESTQAQPEQTQTSVGLVDAVKATDVDIMSRAEEPLRDEFGEAHDVVELLEGTAHKGESIAAIIACNDFLLFGLARSVRGLAQLYKENPESEAPTRSYDTLRRWSEKYDWPKRAIEYDGRMRREGLAARQEIYRSGHASDVMRVDSLSKIAQILEEQILEEGLPEERKVIAHCPKCQETIQVGTGELAKTHPKLWITSVKQVGSGDSARITTTHRFNSSLVAELRNVMNDIAKETGGRRFDLVERVISRLDYRLLPSSFTHRISAGDDVEDVLVDLIESFYTDDPRVHFKRSLPRR